MYTAKPLEKKITIPYLNNLKQQGEKFACLTAYDYSFARLMDRTGVEVVLVGDSLGMVIQGHDTTIPVTVADIEYHGMAVSKGLEKSLLMIDMPFGSLNSQQQALDNASHMIKKTGAQVVKLEGGITQIKTVETLSKYNIPVCAHLGLQPQSVHKMGGYRVQGREHDSAIEMKDTALQIQEAGADLLLLECVPATLAAEISQLLHIPVIGIGAGSDCDGQILVLQDMLGITPGRPPSFSRNFLLDHGSIEESISAYVTEVKNKSFPEASHCFS
ncbi:MAG: 3-methyl-2-oxobutanoate hydroxymethyltransferase [Gammaproteobacteria bacterium]|jgi:3-methyl-2-oxobutanoate hydroxymethyltransferase|nr:3-methyl-2-oxobutanoate hydroxymethyltransferase [Gammaproteobacteria bacterium]MBT3724310.1 3-methyl-2-oxobutanoate hydroxymethyltransferase [Gammaproteobacteria bacterium]MBT4192756.1 3-methyl-2-oxobutanoate hydroxymethyltransferase [Gammaproteobacteria bacterium]MBT4448247.1 3-methyl-2-oxobutanoate hydroxymethyltransferase [Gammaproteobacteria bacterium]MBT4862041.1 3-methyl-2-oxobutanoate hydroxymethyltransferase [Gammaproteobacteria bacterium]